MLKALNNILAKIFSLPVHFYRYAISPLLRPSCRHVPSCSQYALDALKIHGPITGSFLTINRILRCRPGGTHGYDPVPLYWFKKYNHFRLYNKCNRLKH
jgi:putative membrane protein insertion efficiency factor